MTYSAIHGTQKPDIIWDHKKNPEPFNAWRNKQTKVFENFWSKFNSISKINLFYSFGYQKTIPKWKAKPQTT